MEKSASNALIVFQKNSQLGKVKTRLAATVGDRKALEIYQFLIRKTFTQINKTKGLDVYVYFSDYEENADVSIYKENYQFFIQKGKDLGRRMQNAFREIFDHKYEKVVILGTDCPDVTADIIEDAFRKLDQADVVIGPAKDGGYYLLGMNRLFEDLFVDIPWSTSKVLDLSVKKLLQNKIPFQFLPVLSDIDTEEDWNLYRNLITNENE